MATQATIERTREGTSAVLKETVERHVLLVRVGTIVCALDLTHVSETMRALPFEPTPDAPPFVLGLALTRGVPTPVVDLAMLLGHPSGSGDKRWVTLKVDTRTVALAVDAVIGAHRIDASTLSATPPLLGAAAADRVETLGTLDRELLMVLRTARILPAEVFQVPPNHRSAR